MTGRPRTSPTRTAAERQRDHTRFGLRTGHRVYRLTWPELGLCYVGSTTMSVEGRLEQHYLNRDRPPDKKTGKPGNKSIVGKLIAAGHRPEREEFPCDGKYEMLVLEHKLGSAVPDDQHIHKQLPRPLAPSTEAKLAGLFTWDHPHDETTIDDDDVDVQLDFWTITDDPPAVMGQMALWDSDADA